MPRNKLSDLNNHLFEAIEKLRDGEIDIQTAKTLSDLGKNIIEIKKVEVMQAKVLLSAGFDNLVPGTMVIEQPGKKDNDDDHRAGNQSGS